MPHDILIVAVRIVIVVIVIIRIIIVTVSVWTRIISRAICPSSIVWWRRLARRACCWSQSASIAPHPRCHYCYCHCLTVVDRLVATPSTKGIPLKSKCQYCTSPQAVRWRWVWLVASVWLWSWLWWLISLLLWSLLWLLVLGFDRLGLDPPLVLSPPPNCMSILCKVGRLMLHPSLSHAPPMISMWR